MRDCSWHRAVISALSIFAGAAYGVLLGFHGPERMMSPGEVFSVSLVALFEESEVQTWDHSPLASLTVVWPDNIVALNCQLNTNAWDFFPEDTYFEQTSTTAFFWARAVPHFSALSATSMLTIARLSCVAIEGDEDAFFYDVATNYYGVCNGHYTIDTSCSVVYTNSPTSVTYAGNDVLGDPDVPDDGVDELAVLVTDSPGYFLTVIPEEREIPFAREEIVVDVVISGTANAPGYDHVRTVLEYDSSALSNTVIENIPEFFTNITTAVVITNVPITVTNISGDAHVTTNVYVLTNLVEHVLVEGFCVVTNYEGIFVSLGIIPIDIDTTDLELNVGGSESGTVIDRFGIVDLLGSADMCDDGVVDAELTVRYVDGLCLALRPVEDVVVVGEPSEARLVLLKSLASTIEFDALELEMLYNDYLIDTSSLRFVPNPAIFLDNVSNVFQVTSNCFVPPEPGFTNSFLCTNVMVSMDVDWYGDTYRTVSNKVELGRFVFTPRAPGQIGFVAQHIAVEFFIADFSDENAVAAEWPVTLSAITREEMGTRLFVAFESDTNQATTIRPGKEVTLSVCSYGGAVSNASYTLNWLYDDNVLALLTLSDTVTNRSLILANGETATVLRVSSDAFTSSAPTNELAEVRFMALRPGNGSLTPLTPDLSPTEHCRFVDEDMEDLLGSREIVGDGVSQFRLIVKEADELFLNLQPAGTLYAGVTTDLVLKVVNPLRSCWDEVAAEIEFMDDEMFPTTNLWKVLLNPAEVKTVIHNYVTNILVATGLTNSCGVEITNSFCRARIHVQLKRALTNTRAIAALPICPLEDEPTWWFNISTGATEYTHTRVTYKGVLLVNVDRIEEGDWMVYPNGIGIWLSSPSDPPVLGANYVLTAHVDNPHHLGITRARLCWSFDAAQFEVTSIRLTNGFTTNGFGNIWVDNNNDSDGYICADLFRATPTSGESIPLLEITIWPKLNEILEIIPDEDVFPDNREISMGVWNLHGWDDRLNLLETLCQDALDTCPEWRRGILWYPVPQILLDDIFLDKNDIYIIENLLDPTEGLVNGSPDKDYKWWTEGNIHIEVTFNETLHTARIAPEYNWVGVEVFDVFCQEYGSPFVGRTKLRVVVGEDVAQLEVVLDRDEYVAAIDHDFHDIEFEVRNATGLVFVTASIVGSDGKTNLVRVQDVASGAVVTNPHFWTRGRLLWRTPNRVGYYVGTIHAEVFNPSNPYAPSASATFFVDLVQPHKEPDGDRFLVLYNGRGIQLDGRTIAITGGSNRDRLKVKLIEKNGDGLIDLDRISSDAGFRKITLPGSVKLIETAGPLRSLKVHQGKVGWIKVGKGGIRSITINNTFHKDEDDFLEAGIVNGIDCTGNIGTIKIIGGDIGIDDAPAEITVVNGGIRRIITSMKVKRVRDDGWDIYTMGGNIYARINVDRGIGTMLALGGSIGTDFDDATCEICAGRSIKKICAKAKRGDYEVLGGYIHANISCGGRIKSIEASGGDILGTVETEPEDLALETAGYGVTIQAKSIGKIESTAKSFLFRDGPNPKEDWYWETYGGNMGADIRLSGTPGEKYAIDDINVKGGNMCVYLKTAGNIKSIQTKSIRWREDLTSAREVRGGHVDSATIMPNVEYKSTNASDYKGTIGKLSVLGFVNNTWIGIRAPLNPRRFRLKPHQLRGSTEVWVNGTPTMKAQ